MAHLFFDFDDTLSEHALFIEQYAVALGHALAVQFRTEGRSDTEWINSVVSMFHALEKDYVARFVGNPLNGYNSWYAKMPARAAELVFAEMQLPIPPDPAHVAVDALDGALCRCSAIFPGVRETLHALKDQGHTLHIASGNDSRHLAAALTGAGITNCFERLYGPDLIDCAKEGIEFYTRVLEASGCAPESAIVIDNDPNAIRWAQQAGAKVILVRLLVEDSAAETEPILSGIPVVTEFPQVIDAITKTVRSLN